MEILVSRRCRMMPVQNKDAAVYNLQGQPVNRTSARSGIYVQNGRKFVMNCSQKYFSILLFGNVFLSVLDVDAMLRVGHSLAF